MVKEIILKELRGTIISFKFTVTFLVCFITIFLSMYMGMANYKIKLKEYYIGAEVSKKSLQVYDSYETIANEGIQVSKKPNPLGIFCSGVLNHTGDVFTINGFSPPTPNLGKFGRSPILAIFGEFDLSFIVRVILSLFALLYSYDAICGEKESGTLKLILSNALSRTQIIIGKATGLFICLIVSFLVPFLIGLLLLLINGISFSWNEWIRMVFILLTYIFYLLCILFLGLFVSSLTPNSNISFLILLFIWVIFLVLTPMASTVTSELLTPLPSVQEIQSQRLIYMQEYLEGLKRETSRLTHQLRSGSITITDFDKLHRKARIKLMNKMFEENRKYEIFIEKRKESLNRLTAGLSLLSPSSSMTFIASEFAGTSMFVVKNFKMQLEKYQRRFMDYILLQSQKESLIERVLNPDAKIQINYDEIPKFSETELPLTSAFRASLKGIFYLFALLISFIILSYFAFSIYDPR